MVEIRVSLLKLKIYYPDLLTHYMGYNGWMLYFIEKIISLTLHKKLLILEAKKGLFESANLKAEI